MRHRSQLNTPCQDRRRGFTLVELMVVIGIIAMVLGISLPVFTMMQMRRGLRGAVDVTQGIAFKLREVATASGRPAYLVIEHWKSPVRLSAWSVEDNPDGPEPFRFMPIDRPVDLPKGVFLHSEKWTEWINTVNRYGPAPQNMQYSPHLNALCTARGDNTPNYGFNGAGKHEGKAYVLIFKPNGTLDIFGSRNKSPWGIHTDDPRANPPVGDILMTNLTQTVVIDVNPATARVTWRLYDILIGE